MQLIKIKAPRYHDHKVLIAKYKVGNDNTIVFTEAPTYPGEYYISGKDITKYPLQSNGVIQCYAVPLDALTLLERAVEEWS